MDQVDELQEKITQYEISLKAKQVELDEITNEKNEDIKRLEKKVARYEIVQPKTNTKDFESSMKLINESGKKYLIEYLDLDTYELVKNMGATVNDLNAGNAISFMDGGIARNVALRDMIKKSMNMKKEYHDKIKGKIKDKKTK